MFSLIGLSNASSSSPAFLLPGRSRHDKSCASYARLGCDSQWLAGTLSHCAGQNGRLLFACGKARSQSLAGAVTERHRCTDAFRKGKISEPFIACGVIRMWTKRRPDARRFHSHPDHPTRDGRPRSNRDQSGLGGHARPAGSLESPSSTPGGSPAPSLVRTLLLVGCPWNPG